MNPMKKTIGVVLVVALSAFTAAAQTTRQTNVHMTRQLLRRIEDRIDLLRSPLNSSTNRRDQNGSVLLTNFEQSVRQLHQAVDRRTDSATDVQPVLDSASALDRFITGNNFNTTTQRYWTNLRTDLNQLARTYSLSWNRDNNSTYGRDWGRSGYGNSPARLTGTYRLDMTRSDDPSTAIDRALRSVPYQERQQRRDQLSRRLTAPDQIAIDVNGRNVTLASSRARQIVFEADGRERVETTPSGRTIRVRSALNGDQLTVSTTGDRDNEFNVTFFPLENGRRLRVTRRIYAENISTPVEIQSFYDRTADVAQLDIYTGAQQYPTSDNNGDFVLRNGETITAELNTSLSTRNSREGDRFTAIVRSPSQYAGATVEGHISGINRSGRITGRSEMTFNFDRIRLRDGRSYAMAGYLQSLRTPSGDTISVDNEGAVQDDNQSNKTVERTAIGTAIGAVIGAIAGGGRGAAIGAVVGAGGGAGSVYVQGRDDLDLPVGSELTIQATGPR